jgi:hypothetical protein
VQPDRTVLSEMVEEVTQRRTRIPADRTEETQEVEEWQAMLPWARAEERHSSWLESYMWWMKGMEGRTRYHALLEEELASLRG